jgi:hypothetical protein
MARYLVIKGNVNNQNWGPAGVGAGKLQWVYKKGQVFDTSEVKISKESMEHLLARGAIAPYKEHRGAKPDTPPPVPPA